MVYKKVNIKEFPFGDGDFHIVIVVTKILRVPKADVLLIGPFRNRGPRDFA